MSHNDNHENDHQSEDEDALFASLDDDSNDSLPPTLREQRLQQLHAEFSLARTQRLYGSGTYTVLTNDKAVLDLTTSKTSESSNTASNLVVLHFSKDGFVRCKFMDEKLEVLCKKHLETRFAKVDVENVPFLVEKLAVRVLPCVICFKDGVAVDRIIGFEGLNGTADGFRLQALEKKLIDCGVLTGEKVDDEDVNDGRRNIRKKEANEDEDDDDWD